MVLELIRARTMGYSKVECAELDAIWQSAADVHSKRTLLGIIDQLVEFQQRCQWCPPAYVEGLIRCLADRAETLGASHADFLEHGVRRWSHDGRFDLGVRFAQLAQDKATNGAQLMANSKEWELLFPYVADVRAPMLQCLGRLEELAHSTQELLRVAVRWARIARLDSQEDRSLWRLTTCGIVRCLGQAAAASQGPADSNAIEGVCAAIVEELGKNGPGIIADQFGEDGAGDGIPAEGDEETDDSPF